MHKHNSELVESFFNLVHQQSSTAGLADILADDVRYDLFIIMPFQREQSFCGKDEVGDYLSVVQRGYQPIQRGERKYLSTAENEVVIGNDLAWLPLHGCLADVGWCAVIECANGKIQKVTMRIHYCIAQSAGTKPRSSCPAGIHSPRARFL